MPVIKMQNLAAEWLEEILADGPMEFQDIWAQAKELNFSRGTLQRASAKLSLTKTNSKTYPKCTTWSL